MSKASRHGEIKRTLLIALAGNIISTIIKLIFGLLANSIAMISDAVHSLLDSVSSIVGMYGNRIGQKPPDLEHPYGHQKFEYISALVITVMMIIAGFNIIHEAIERLLSGVFPNITYFSFAAIIISLFISLSISIYERIVGKKTSSAILMADSFHTLTDVFASLVVIAGFIGTLLGVLYADSIAAIIICFIIAYVAASLFRSSTKILVDQGVSNEILAKIRSITNGVCGDEMACHAVRGRIVGDRLFVDMHVAVKGELSVEDSHKITETIERRLKEEIKGTEEVIIHTEPRGEHDNI